MKTKLNILLTIALFTVFLANSATAQDELLSKNIKNCFYIKPPFLAFPIGSYTNGANYAFGITYELGNMFYFNKLNIHPHLKAGCLITYYNFSMIFTENEDEWGSDKEVDLFLGFKLGPLFSYTLSEKSILDMYFQVAPSLSQINSPVFGEGSSSIGSLSFRNAFGVNVSYSVFMLGAEYNFGSVWNNENGNSTDKSVRIDYLKLSVGLRITKRKK